MKKTISKAIRNLEHQFGAKVYNFQGQRALPQTCKGFPDYVVIYKTAIWFLEMKLISTKDKLSEQQKEFSEFIHQVKGNIGYRIINEDNYQEIILEILNVKK